MRDWLADGEHGLWMKQEMAVGSTPASRASATA